MLVMTKHFVVVDKTKIILVAATASDTNMSQHRKLTLEKKILLLLLQGTRTRDLSITSLPP